MPDLDIDKLMSDLDTAICERASLHDARPELGMTEARDARRREADLYRGQHNLDRLTAKKAGA